MKKGEKGCYGYIDEHKKTQLLRTIILFLLPAAIFLAGYLTTKTRANLFTVIAVVGCLPACKSLVNVLVFTRRRSMPKEMYEEISAHAQGMEAAYELLLTTYDKTYPIHCAVIKGNEIACYMTMRDCDPAKAQEHIVSTMKNNNLPGIHVHFFQDLTHFMARVDALAAKEPEEIKFTPDERYPGLNREQVIRRILLALSL